jgi:hypothetical protein
MFARYKTFLLMFCHNLHIISHFCWTVFLFLITLIFFVMWCLMHLSQSSVIVGNTRLYFPMHVSSMFTRKFTAVFCYFRGSAGIQLSSISRVHLFFCLVLHFRWFGWEFLLCVVLSFSPAVFHFFLIFSSIGFEIQERPIGIYRDWCVLICDVISLIYTYRYWYHVSNRLWILYCKYSR